MSKSKEDLSDRNSNGRGFGEVVQKDGQRYCIGKVIATSELGWALVLRKMDLCTYQQKLEGVQVYLRSYVIPLTCLLGDASLKEQEVEADVFPNPKGSLCHQDY